jgi:hypothetical protein
MAESLKELRGLSDKQLIEEHDNCAASTSSHIHFYLEEIKRRDQNRQTETIIKYTRIMMWLTVFIAILTVANVVAVMVQVCR